MRNGMKNSISILYNRNAIIDGCGEAFLGCCVCFWLPCCESRRHPNGCWPKLGCRKISLCGD